MSTTRSVMPTKENIWLRMQGLDPNNLPSTATWYTKDGRQFEGKMDKYTLNLYRTKGYVLDKKYRNRIAWYALEFGGSEWLDEHLRRDFNLPPEIADVLKEQNAKADMPSLATAILSFMEGKSHFEGTASTLLSGLPSKVGLPKSPIKLSAEIIQPRVTNALAINGIEITRYRTAKSRMLLITRHQ